MLEQERVFYQNNRQKLRQLLGVEKDLGDLIVVTGHSFMQASADRAFSFEQDSNFFYLTGITEPEVTLVIDGDKEYLIVPERSDSRLAFEGSLDVEHMKQVSGISTILEETEGWSLLADRLNETAKVATLEAYEEYISSMEMFNNPSRRRLIDRMQKEVKDLKLQDIRKLLMNLRMVKSDYEIKMIRRAFKETYDLFEVIEEKLADVTYEHELLAEITRLRVQKQLVFSYDPIIASGKNALTLHYVKNNSELDKSGMLLLDIGLKYNGYAADITRTISFNPTKRQKEVFGAVLAVQTYAISVLKPGITVKEYEEQVHKYMGEQLLDLGLIADTDQESIRKFCPHSTSHFLGIDVHDTGDYQRPLEPGMVLTVEPGIYIKDESIGIRLEDDVLITKNGNEILSGALPKNISSLTIQK